MPRAVAREEETLHIAVDLSNPKKEGSRMQSYPLDLATMLYNLRGQRGRLTATVERVGSLREPCQVVLDLAQGKVTHAALLTGRGALVAEGQQALDLLGELGTIDWRWEPASVAGLTGRLGFAPRNPLLAIPHRHASFSPSSLYACSRLQRRVLGLVDGRRTVADIATLLSVPATELEYLQAILNELVNMGLIVLEE